MKDEVFRDFRRRLFHGCLTVVNTPVKRYMLTWDVVRCSDHHFRRAIYGLGPHIADYPEQLVAAGTVYGWCVTSVYSLVPVVHVQHSHTDERLFSCKASPTNLNDPAAELRTREEMFALLETEDDDTLWFDHGIVPDFLVRRLPLLCPKTILTTNPSHLQPPFPEQISTNFLHQTSFIKSSREHIRTILSHGSKSTLRLCTVLRERLRSWTRLIEGRYI